MSVTDLAGDYAVIEGVVIDLRCEQVDVTGVIWFWTGVRDSDGQPLMQSYAGASTPSSHAPVPLMRVYLDHGPLVAAPHRPSHDECRRAVLGGAA